jgi:hypothetical protein
MKSFPTPNLLYEYGTSPTLAYWYSTIPAHTYEHLAEIVETLQQQGFVLVDFDAQWL